MIVFEGVKCVVSINPRITVINNHNIWKYLQYKKDAKWINLKHQKYFHWRSINVLNSSLPGHNPPEVLCTLSCDLPPPFQGEEDHRISRTVLHHLPGQLGIDGFLFLGGAQPYSWLVHGCVKFSSSGPASPHSITAIRDIHFKWFFNTTIKVKILFF